MADTNTDEYWGRNAYGGYGDARDPTKRSGMADETNDYRRRGNVAGATPAYQADRTAFNGSMGQGQESRGYQVGALGYLDKAASGAAPSEAEILGKKMTSDALAGQQAVAASATGGPMQQAAASTAAAAKQGAYTQNAAATQQAGRAAEMAQARGQFAQQSNAIRGSDQGDAGINLQKTGQDIQNEQFQRGLDANTQLAYEQMRQKTFEDQLNANQNAQSESDQAWNAGRANKMADESNSFGKIMKIGGAVAGAATGGVATGFAAGAGGGSGSGGDAGSDERMKFDITPIGSLSTSPAMSQGGADPTGTTKMRGGGMDVMGSLKANSDAAMRYQKNPGGAAMYSDERAKSDVHAVGFAQGYRAHAADSDASKAVGATRKAGGYADPDAVSSRTDTTQLHAALDDDTEGTDPYYRAPEIGVAGAPRGYAADHPQASGDSVDSATRPELDTPPGTTPKTAAEPDWKRGGATTEKGRASSGGGSSGRTAAADILSGMSKNLFAGAFGTGRETTTSDARAKEAAGREGYLLGRAHQQEQNASGKPVEFAYGGAPRDDEDIVDKDPGARGSAIPGPGGGPRPYAAPETGRDPARGPEAKATSASGLTGLQAVPGQVKSAALRVREKANRTIDAAMGRPLPDEEGKRDVTPSDSRAKKVIEEEEPMADANRSMEPSEYRYKSPFTPPGQEPGEVNVGPIAQNMERSPLAKTAIVKEPNGLLAIDKEKGLKLVMGGLSSLQAQVDALSRAGGKKRSA